MRSLLEKLLVDFFGLSIYKFSIPLFEFEDGYYLTKLYSGSCLHACMFGIHMCRRFLPALSFNYVNIVYSFTVVFSVTANDNYYSTLALIFHPANTR